MVFLFLFCLFLYLNKQTPFPSLRICAGLWPAEGDRRSAPILTSSDASSKYLVTWFVTSVGGDIGAKLGLGS